MALRRTEWRGLPIVIENEAGSRRKWSGGETLMRFPYGYFADHAGSDGDELDCYLGPDHSARFVYVVHQLAPDGSRDEDKCFLDFAGEAAAKAGYLVHRDDGDRAYGGMSVIPAADFIAKLRRRTGDGKIRHSVMSTRPVVLFDAARDSNGKVRSGVWDFVCVDGWDMKDGSFTEFTADTLGQMVANFEAKGDAVPYDWNHQTFNAPKNGRPALALAWAGAMAVVWDGQIAKMGKTTAPEATGTEPGLDLARNGLWAFRSEVTDGTADCPLGQQLLPGFKYLSPGFTSAGVDRQNNPVGYQMLAIACENTPWQGGTQITFGGANAPGNAPATSGARRANQETPMDESMMKRFGFEPDDDDAKKAEKMAKYFAGVDDMKAKMDAATSAAGGALTAPAAMAAEPEKPAAMAATEPAAEEKDAEKKVMAATLKTAMSRLATLEAAEKTRADAAVADGNARIEKLADAAVAGGYGKEDRPHLVAFARANFDGAFAAVKHLLPKGTNAPAHLFGRVSAGGGPIGAPADGSGARDMPAPKAPTVRHTAFGVDVVESDEHEAAEIRKLAFSAIPADVAAVDDVLSGNPAERKQPAMRLVAARKVLMSRSPEKYAAAADRRTLMSAGILQ